MASTHGPRITIFHILLCQFLWAFGICTQVTYVGPKVKIQTPRRGAKLESVVQVSLYVDIGVGSDAAQIQANPTGYKVCFTGGKEVHCSPLVGGSGLGYINVSSTNEISEVFAWIQSNNDLVSVQSAFGEIDVVVGYDSAAKAIKALRERSFGYGTWGVAASTHSQALRHFDLGHALMRAQPMTGTPMAANLVEAAAALGASIALGFNNAVGALEEVLWLSGSRSDKFPLMPCGYNGVLDIPLIEGGPSSTAAFGVYLSAVGDWSDAREAIRVSLSEHCEHHSKVEECIGEGVKEARNTLVNTCGDLTNLETVVKAHSLNPSDINEHILTLESLAAQCNSVYIYVCVCLCASIFAIM
jgi:hypothetical protein